MNRFFRRIRPCLTLWRVGVGVWLILIIGWATPSLAQGPNAPASPGLAPNASGRASNGPPPPPAPPQAPNADGMSFRVEYSSPGGQPGATPSAPPTAPGIDPKAVNSPVPPTPPKLGTPTEAAPPAEPEKPLTPQEIEANQRKEELLNELRSWRESVNRDYAFTGATISDPFMPVESVAQPKPPTVAGEEELRAKPMIQKLALNQFTLVAIVVGKNGENNLAMVDSGGKGYIVKKGDLIGNNKGYVKEITQNKLIVEEPEIISRASKSPRITEFRLNALGDNDGEITLSSYGE